MTVAINSVLLPVCSVPPSMVVDTIEAARKKLIELATDALHKSEGELVIRDLFPTDLGLTYEHWFEKTGATANAWENTSIASKTMGDERFVAITGVLDLSVGTPASALRITVGGSKVAQWHLDKLAQQESRREGITLSPIIITQNQPITIDRYVKEINQGTEIVYQGLVCEKIGKVLKP